MTIPTNTNENQAQAADQTKSDSIETNLVRQRKMYEAQLEKERQARLAAERALQEREASPRKSVDEDAEDDDNEPYVDKRRLKKEIKQVSSQIKQDTQQEIRSAVQSAISEERRTGYLKQNADFNDIMQPEMMQKFVDKYPTLAEGILSMPEGFERQKLVYENIKALGLHKKEEPKQSVQQTIDANRKSPYYQPSGMGTAPYAAAGDFSPAGQKNAYAKLQELKNKLRL